MADTNTANVKLVNQTEGGNANSWGTIADSNFEEIDDKFGDVTSISTTGGTTTLTDSQEIVNAIVVTGTLVSNATIVFSGRGGTWIVKNGTSGAYTLTCKVSGQSGVELTQGTKQAVFCNGTDIEAAGGPSNATEIPTGVVAPYIATTAPSGWIIANGKTIGNASSGGTGRANADTETLFALLWDSHLDAILGIQDSAGTTTTRGASAAADYAANKRLVLPDLRGRSLFGLDDMGSTAASRITTASTFLLGNPTINGASLGSQTVVLVEANLAAHTHTGPSHAHSVSITSAGQSVNHTHTFSATTASGGTHTHTVSGGTVGGTSASSSIRNDGSAAGPIGTGTVTIDSGGAHTHTVTGTTGEFSADHTHLVSGTTAASGTGTTGTTGSGTAHANMPPAWLLTFIIKL